MKKKLATILLMSVVAMTTGCLGRGSGTAEPTPTASVATTTKNNGGKISGNQLIVSMNNPETLNPLYNTKENSQQALYLIFNTLINIEEDGTISQNLAESWVANESNTVVTVTLGNSIFWHDGQKLTSDDVIFTLNKIKNIPDSPYKQAVTNLDRVEKIDDLTFKLIYKQAFSGTLQTLFFPVIPEHIYKDADPEDTSIKPIGTGPYMFDSLTPLESINLVANPNYFKGQPKIDQVKVEFVPDADSTLYSFKQGLIDVAYTTNTEWGKYMDSEANTSYEMVSSIYEFMGLNFSKGIFQNDLIREALACGVNRQEIIKKYYLGQAEITDTPVSPASYLFNKNLEIRKYDKEKAKLLLTQAGYNQDAKTGYMLKNGTSLAFTLLVNQDNNSRVKVAKEIQSMYKEIGIDVKLDIVDAKTYLEKLKSHNFDAFLGGWNLSYATDLSFAFHSQNIAGGNNFIGFSSQTMDDLLHKNFVSTSADIVANYEKFQEYFAATNPYISLYFTNSVLMVKNAVGGDIEPDPLNVFANVEKWEIK